MKIKAVSGIMLTLLLTGMLTLAFIIQPAKASGTIYISSDYTFTSNIYEPIVVTADNIIIDGAGYTVQGTGSGIGINMTWRSNVTLKNVEVTNFNYGIWLSYSNNNVLTGNTASNNQYGIYLSVSSNNTLTSNTASNNQYNFDVSGFLFSHYSNDIDTSNTVDGKPIYYLIDEANVIIDAETNAGTIYAINSNNITIKNLTLTKNCYGVFFFGTTNSKIENVTASNNGGGIYLSVSSNNVLSGNTASNNNVGINGFSINNNILTGNTASNNGNGIYLSSGSRNNVLTGNTASNNGNGIYLSSGSRNNVLTGNTASNNGNGIRLAMSSNNTLFHNNLISNTVQASVTTGYVNTWDDGYPSGGNYWDDYGKVDADGDGIGDMPYVIDANNTDRYPLVVPIGPIPIIWDEMIYPVELKSNSTISRFQFKASQKMISFNVTGPEGTLGFCNLTIPNSLVQDLWQGDFTVLVDGEEPITMNNWTDGTYTYIYFTYLHSTHKVIIIPEFPTWTPILLTLIILAVVIAIYKRRLLKTPIH